MRGSHLRGLGERLLCRFRPVADASTRVGEASPWEAEAERRVLRSLLTKEDLQELKLGSAEFGIYSCTTPGCVLHRADVTREGGYGEVDEASLRQLVEDQSTVGVRRRLKLVSAYQKCGNCLRQTQITRRKTIRAATTRRCRESALTRWVPFTVNRDIARNYTPPSARSRVERCVSALTAPPMAAS